MGENGNTVKQPGELAMASSGPPPSGGGGRRESATAIATKNQKNRMTTMKGIILQPEDMDVLMGRGRTHKDHPGNQRFHDLLLAHRDSYLVAHEPLEKYRITTFVVDEVLQCGRFLKPDDNNAGGYYSRNGSSKSPGSKSRDPEPGASGRTSPFTWTALTPEGARLKVAHAFQYMTRKVKSGTHLDGSSQPQSSSSCSSSSTATGAVAHWTHLARGQGIPSPSALNVPVLPQVPGLHGLRPPSLLSNDSDELYAVRMAAQHRRITQSEALALSPYAARRPITGLSAADEASFRRISNLDLLRRQQRQWEQQPERAQSVDAMDLRRYSQLDAASSAVAGSVASHPLANGGSMMPQRSTTVYPGIPLPWSQPPFVSTPQLRGEPNIPLDHHDLARQQWRQQLAAPIAPQFLPRHNNMSYHYQNQGPSPLLDVASGERHRADFLGGLPSSNLPTTYELELHRCNQELDRLLALRYEVLQNAGNGAATALMPMSFGGHIPRAVASSAAATSDPSALAGATEFRSQSAVDASQESSLPFALQPREALTSVAANIASMSSSRAPANDTTAGCDDGASGNVDRPADLIRPIHSSREGSDSLITTGTSATTADDPNVVPVAKPTKPRHIHRLERLEQVRKLQKRQKKGNSSKATTGLAAVQRREEEGCHGPEPPIVPDMARKVQTQMEQDELSSRDSSKSRPLDVGVNRDATARGVTLRSNESDPVRENDSSSTGNDHSLGDGDDLSLDTSTASQRWLDQSQSFDFGTPTRPNTKGGQPKCGDDEAKGKFSNDQQATTPISLDSFHLSPLPDLYDGESGKCVSIGTSQADGGVRPSDQQQPPTPPPPPQQRDGLDLLVLSRTSSWSAIEKSTPISEESAENQPLWTPLPGDDKDGGSCSSDDGAWLSMLDD